METVFELIIDSFLPLKKSNRKNFSSLTRLPLVDTFISKKMLNHEVKKMEKSENGSNENESKQNLILPS